METTDKYTFKITQEPQIKAFYLRAMIDPALAGYLSMGSSTYMPEPDTTIGLWTGVTYVNEDCTALGRFNISRGSRDDVSISGFVLGGKKILAGRLMLFMKSQLKLVNPHTVNSTVLVSNTTSMRITTKLLGEPWGIEPDAGYDGVLGKWVDVAHFRRRYDEIK